MPEQLYVGVEDTPKHDGAATVANKTLSGAMEDLVYATDAPLQAEDADEWEEGPKGVWTYTWTEGDTVKRQYRLEVQKTTLYHGTR